MDAKKIGAILIKLRGENRTQQEVADSIGVTVSAIGMYERGERIPRDEIKIRLAEYYGKSIGEIFFDDKDTVCVCEKGE